MSPLGCPKPGCDGTVIEVNIEVYEGAVFVDDQTGEITWLEGDEREDHYDRTDCYTDRFTCSKAGVHEWEDIDALRTAIKEASDGD